MARPLNQGSGLPQLGGALLGWMKRITIVRRVQAVNGDGRVSYVNSPIAFQGMIQPLSPKSVALKPEGQRDWTWLQIHALTALNLNIDDQIVYNGQPYKVMALLDYSLNGYMEYHVVQDYSSS